MGKKVAIEQTTNSSIDRWVTVAMLWLTHTVSFLNYTSFGTLAPFIKDELNLTSSQIGLFVSVASIGAILVQFPAGVLLELFGIRRTIFVSVMVIGFSAILLSQVTSFWTAIPILFVFGLASGSITPAAAKAIIGLFPFRGRATAMSIKQTGINMGGILAGILMPTLAVWFNWRYGLMVVGVGEMICSIFIYLFCKDPWESSTNHLPLSFILNKFRKIIVRKDILLIGGIGMFFIATQFCFSTYIVLYLTKELLFPIRLAGTYFTFAFLAGAFARIGWSAFSDYFLHGKRKLILLIISFLSAITCSLLGWSSPLNFKSWMILLLTLLLGLTGIGWNAIWLAMIGELIDRESSGMTTSAAIFVGNLGILLGPPLFGYILDITKSYNLAWQSLALSALATIGLLCLLRENE